MHRVSHDYLDVALRAAREAGGFLHSKAGHIQEVEFKGVSNLVTEADKGAEEIICQVVHAAFPHHRILAEERGEEGGRGGAEAGSDGDPCLWVIDPLDGTTNFVHGLPNYAVSIGVERAGEVVAGVVYAPALQELFLAERAAGALHNDQRLRVSKTDRLRDALLATGFPYEPDGDDWNTGNVTKLVPLCRDVRRLGSAALDMAYVACGRFDGYWEFGVNAWDISAGRLLVTEAGGKVSDFTGRPFSARRGRIVASNGLIHDEVVQLLSSGKAC